MNKSPYPLYQELQSQISKPDLYTLQNSRQDMPKLVNKLEQTRSSGDGPSKFKSFTQNQSTLDLNKNKN